MGDNILPLRIILQKNFKRLGMHLAEQAKAPRVYIKELVLDGLMAQSGLVEKGDRLIRVNDKDVSNSSKTSVKKFLESFPAGTIVTILLQCKEGFRINLQKVTENDQLKIYRKTVPAKLLQENRNNNSSSIIRNENPTLQKCPGHQNVEAKKPLPLKRVRNYITDGIHTDLLSRAARPEMKCSPTACTGSLMAQQPRGPPGKRSKEELLTQAEDFMKQFFTNSNKLDSEDHKTRWNEVLSSVKRTGTYELTYEELIFATKTAWRNASRCIGRIQWSKLHVFDARQVKTAKDMFEAICTHIEYGTNKGNIRSAITIFPHRTDGEHDFRVWNAQFIKFAGHKQPDGSVIGDPGSVEFTELCMSMGWKPKGTRFDPLPMILQANGEDPELFELPDDIVLMVKLKHPRFEWFEALGLKWYCVPAVANMCLDVGGLEFTGAPFNGWYMGTEIGARNLCDPMRYNLLPELGEKMGLDTSKNTSLWKDSVLVEVNIAVLHSFECAGVTIADHHSTSESFMKFMSDEFRLRGGCPADWVWIVPPMSGSLCPVFHQEMYNYVLKPSYEYQIDAWKTYIWRKDREAMKNGKLLQKRKIKLRELAIAVSFAASLMKSALEKRNRCTILYATETGKSETFAKKVNSIFQQAFNSKVMCMADYAVADLAKESLVLVVTSTFGSGDPPDNGVSFANTLSKMVKESGNSRNSESQDNSGPLSRMKYAVFALGSRAYVNFCEFGHTVNRHFASLGGQRILDIGEGDELSGQEMAFQTWAVSVFQAACTSFSISEDANLSAATKSMLDSSWTPGKFRITAVTSKVSQSLTAKLKHVHKKNAHECVLTSRKALQASHSEKETVLVTFDCQGNKELTKYSPGDHVAVFPANRQELVDGVINRLCDAPSLDNEVQLEVRDGDSTIGDSSWNADARLPACSIREMFIRYLDIASPPSPGLLQQLAKCADKDEKKILEKLASDTVLYEEWKTKHNPTLSNVLKQFPSLQVPTTLLITQLPLLQARYYSISSSAAAVPGEIHATVAVVKYKTIGNPDGFRYGVCSSWLNEVAIGEKVPCYIRTAESFHMPKDNSLPCLLVGPGTGIAPFRGFIQQRRLDMTRSKIKKGSQSGWGPMTLYFGCRQSKLDNLHSEETKQAKEDGVLANVYTAFSREPNQPKKYVQDLLWKNGRHVNDHIAGKNGHFYVCGDAVMAGDVEAMLEIILCFYSQMTPEEAKSYITQMRECNRYHEDIFGASFRQTASVKLLNRRG